MRTTNKVSVRFSQDLSYVGPSRKGKDGVVKPGRLITFGNEMVFSDETEEEVTAENVGSWAVAKVGHALKLMRLQGKTGFKISKPIVMEVTINGKRVELSYWKMSLNLDRIERIMGKSPELLAYAFTGYKHNVSKSTAKDGFAFLANAASGKTLLAPAVTNNPLLPAVNTEGLEELEVEETQPVVTDNLPVDEEAK